MNKDEMINELKKDLVYNPYRDTYVIRGENLPFMAERLVKLFDIPAVIKSVCQCCGKRTIDYFNTKCKSCGTEHAYKQTVL